MLSRPIAVNKRARHDYQILSELEAGVVLSGQEVKSVKTGHISLKGAFVTIKNNEAYLTGALIPPYKFAGPLPDYDPTRSRKLLLTKPQLRSLIGKAKTEGLTIVPLSVYTKKRLIKVRLAIAKGKKLRDKRETIKKRQAKRLIGRVMRGK